VDAILKKKINILIRLAAVDGHFVPKEKHFIQSICQRHGLDRHAVDEIIQGPDPIGSLGALSYKTTVEYLTESMMLMLVDGKVLPSEILFCEDIGLRLGFTKKAIDGLISRIRQNMGISIEEMKKLVVALPHPLKA
jgi:phage I-like protein